MSKTDPSEAILDDLFVLWRALESTFDRQSLGGGQRDRALNVVVETIAYHGMAKLPRITRLVRELKVFETASPAQIAEWFATEDPADTTLKSRIISQITVLRQAIAPPVRWSKHDSKKLGDLLYRTRCAVIHPSLDTNNSLVVEVLPALREALIELIIARVAQEGGLTLAEAGAAFNHA
jgi:hypothetical protein